MAAAAASSSSSFSPSTDPPNLHRPIVTPTVPPPPPNPPSPPFPPPSIGSSSQPSDQLITVPCFLGYPMPPGRNPSVVGFPFPASPFVFLPDHQTPPAARSVPFVRPPVAPRPAGNTNSGGPGGVPEGTLRRKVARLPPIPSASNSNRGKSRNHSVLTIHDRKVRLSDAGPGTLYALCRSWIQNGYPQENQPQIGESVKHLPRPLPTTVPDTCTSKRDEDDDGDELLSKEEHGGSVENLSAHDLLEGHIKRAKRVRTLLREERHKRINRYQQRFSLLLHSLRAMQCKNNDAANSR